MAGLRCREYGDDLKNVFGQIFLERGVLTLVDDNDFDVFRFTNRKNKFCTESQ